MQQQFQGPGRPCSAWGESCHQQYISRPHRKIPRSQTHLKWRYFASKLHQRHIDNLRLRWVRFISLHISFILVYSVLKWISRTLKSIKCLLRKTHSELELPVKLLSRKLQTTEALSPKSLVVGITERAPELEYSPEVINQTVSNYICRLVILSDSNVTKSTT